MAHPQVEKQAARNAAIVALALQQLRQLLGRVDWESPDAVSVVKLIYRAVVTRYGRAAAAVGAEFYDQVRAEHQIRSEFRAVPAAPLPEVVTEKAVESAFKGVRVVEVDAGEEVDGSHVRVTEVPTSELSVDQRVQQRLEAAAGRHVLQPGRDTIAENTAEDPAKPVWIRVPTGERTCEFCLMLASRELGPNFSGYASRRNALFRENGEKYHKNCDCVAIPLYPSDDPHEISPNMADYQRIYNKAAANAGTRSDAKKVLAEMRKQIKAETAGEQAPRRPSPERATPQMTGPDRPPAAAGGGGDDGGNGNNGGVAGSGDDDWNAHVSFVKQALVDAPTTEQLFKDDLLLDWTPERTQQQRELLNAFWADRGVDAVPRDGKAVIAGGIAGAGKTTVLNGPADIDTSQYFTINPDDIKEAMAARGMIPEISGLSPMEASTKAHEEASELAKILAARAYEQQINVIWDITMSSESSVLDRIVDLRAAGYTEIDAVFVNIPLETSRSRAMQRWRSGQERLASGQGLGGRYVPDDFIETSRPTKRGFSSKNEEVFDQVKHHFDSTVEYDNSGTAPVKRGATGPRWE